MGIRRGRRDENRLYPWGPDDVAPNLANYGGSDNTPLVDVGSKPDGAGRWGHLDLAGSVGEWMLDYIDDAWYSNAAAVGPNPANLVAASSRVLRGNSYSATLLHTLRSADRFRIGTGARDENIGVRCARER